MSQMFMCMDVKLKLYALLVCFGSTMKIMLGHSVITSQYAIRSASNKRTYSHGTSD